MRKWSSWKSARNKRNHLAVARFKHTYVIGYPLVYVWSVSFTALCFFRILFLLFGNFLQEINFSINSFGCYCCWFVKIIGWLWFIVKQTNRLKRWCLSANVCDAVFIVASITSYWMHRWLRAKCAFRKRCASRSFAPIVTALLYYATFSVDLSAQESWTPRGTRHVRRAHSIFRDYYSY